MAELAMLRATPASEIAARASELASGSVLHVVGAAGSMVALVAHAVSRATSRPVVCVTAEQEGARALADDLAFVSRARTGDGGDSELVVYAAPDSSPYADVNPDRRAGMARQVTLFHLALGLPLRFGVIAAAGLLRRVPPRDIVARHTVHLRAGAEVQRDELLARLTLAGYVRVPLVEDEGTFAVRGAVVDLWPGSTRLPVRAEFDGDRVASLRPFDPTLQHTVESGPDEEGSPKVSRLERLAEIFLPPAREAIVTPEAAERARAVVQELCDRVDWPSSRARALVEDVASGRSFFGADGFLPAYYPLATLTSYLPKDAIVLLDDPASMTREVRSELERAQEGEREKESEPHLPRSELYESEDGLVEALRRHPIIAVHRTAVMGAPQANDLTRFEAVPEDALRLVASDQGELERAITQSRSAGGKHRTLDPLVEHIASWTESGLRVVAVTRTGTQAERLASLLRNRAIELEVLLGGLAPGELDDPRRGARVVVTTGPLARGVVAEGEGLVLVTEEEIFGRKAHRAEARARKEKARPFLDDLRALSVGDHVVHVEHGVGRYLGLLHKEIGGITVDLLVVEYAGGDKLYLPVYRLNQIEKWAGGEGTPKLDRLGGQTFAKTRARAEKEVRQMADELLRLYAERKAAVAEPLAPADDEFRAFEATFPYEETPDQARAIADTLADIDSGRPMDRLVCGDVGFGKTEVAIRAAFRVAVAGKQVAVLCPTTVLAQQHFLSFSARMKDSGLNVGVMSRFQSKAEQAETVRGLKAGTLDVVIGTHRLLSKDVHFRRLGLLVVDEEQRFGVAHKERIKQLRRDVHVLTLTATPIPRTLQMAVSGLRDMSVIATPPADRRAIRTITTRAEDAVMREAVRRELDRGGQVFYVYNRVEGLHERAARLAALLPGARIAVGHGKMKEHALEQAMLEFVQGSADVLVSTAIIESGLDIPRANTMLIDRADLFGLSDLYQLRGRVGRAKERGYCYLMVPPASSMTDEARARIEALERHTELGSGFLIASLDLELRGAGDLLGADQSGTVAAVGFDLFCRMLEEAVHELKGEPVVHEVDPELSFDVEALLPEAYVSDVGVRLSLYKRLASASSEGEVLDLAAEMEDRFGPPPDEARRFVHLMRVKTELRRLRVLGCEATARSVTLHLRDDTPLDPAKLTALVTRRGSPYRITPDMRLMRRMQAEPAGGPVLRGAHGKALPQAADGLEAIDTVLSELAPCARDDASESSKGRTAEGGGSPVRGPHKLEVLARTARAK